MMRIFYVSNYVDQKYFEKIFDLAVEKPIQSIQKFNRLFVNGMNKNEYVESIDILSVAPVNRRTSKKLFWKGKNLKEEKVNFKYLPFINLKFIKQICIAIFSIFFVLNWCIKNYKKESVLISDGFFPIVSTIATIFCKLFGIKIVTLYTDLIKVDMHDVTCKKNNIRRVIKKVINFGDNINSSLSDGFILLTEQMNEVVNKKNKPYIIMEGLVDSNFEKVKITKRKKAIMYAGGLYEKYGVKLLIDSFIKWNNLEYELWLCGGDGDLIEYIKSLNKKNVIYFGALPNTEIVSMEQKCMFLVNPRFSNEAYTKYSFPSKNMEYMLSGTPLLTTKLPGMPKEYNEYVYLIEEETENGFIREYKNIVDKSNKEINEFAQKAQDYVKQNKNNIVQANRIIIFIKKIVKR